MGNVISLFGEPIEPPAAEESDFVQEFVETKLGDFTFAVEALVEASTEDDFRHWMTVVKEQVEDWP